MQYLLYYLIGGVVAGVAYIGTHRNGMLASFVASVPVLFLLNLLLMYRNGGLG